MVLGLALMPSSSYAKPLSWEITRPSSPQQEKYGVGFINCTSKLVISLIVRNMKSVVACSGHDCGLLVMAFIEVLAIHTDGCTSSEDTYGS